MEETNKKYILWTYADYGWHPKGFDSIKEALEEERYTHQWFITSGEIDYEVKEKYMKEEKIYKCPDCGRELDSPAVICPCEVAPKYDPDYEEWRNK